MFIFNEGIQEDLRKMREKIYSLETSLFTQELKFQRENEILHSQILRLKNGDQLSDDYITKKLTYLDMSPERAFEFYNDKDKNFFLLDVSESRFQPIAELPEVYRIPLEDLEKSNHRLPGKNHSILVISEKGVRSILACKVLHEMGFHNLNNVSGGYKFWPGFRKKDNDEEEDIFVA